MSDTNVAEVAENTNEAVEASTETQEKVVSVKRGNVTLELDGITEGSFAGFKFWRPKFESLDDAVEHFTSISQNGKPGDDTILGLLNSALGARHRSLANSKLTIPAKIKGNKAKEDAFIAERSAKLASPNEEDRILISQDDAYEYIPGEREVDSLSGLNTQKTKLFKAAAETKKKYVEAVKIGNQELASRLKEEVKVQVAKYQDVCVKIKEKEEKEQSDILALVED